MQIFCPYPWPCVAAILAQNEVKVIKILIMPIYYSLWTYSSQPNNYLAVYTSDDYFMDIIWMSVIVLIL
jgi:hypothetical protein